MYESFWRFPAGVFSEFERIQREMESMFGGFGLPASIRAVARGAFPTVNIGSTPSSAEVYVFLPGIDSSKLEVTVDRGLLTIAGERITDLPEESDKLSVYAAERFSGAFKRVVSLPEGADAVRIDARYRDGVLRVSIAMSESAQPKRIQVQ